MIRMNAKWLVPAVLLALTASSSAVAQVSTNYGLEWSVISSGGGEVTSSSYVVNGTAGQSVPGCADSLSYKLWAGFWVPSGLVGPVEIDRIDEAKLLADGTQVRILGKIATTSEIDFNFSGMPLCIEEANRSSGIRVAVTTPVAMLARGNKVDVVGTMGTTSAGERQIESPNVTIADFSTDAALSWHEQPQHRWR